MEDGFDVTASAVESDNNEEVLLLLLFSATESGPTLPPLRDETMERTSSSDPFRRCFLTAA